MQDRNRVAALLAFLLHVGLPIGAGAAPFSVVLLPDTQHYTDSPTNIVHFEAQTQWIVDNQVLEDIAFTTLVGDAVQNGGQGPDQNQVEWNRALGAIDTLHDHASDPAYAAVIGNHDYDTVGSKSSADQYLAHLGAERYSGKSWFVGAAPDELNMTQEFTGAGERFLHIGLEWLPSDEAIAYAQSVITADPTVPVVLSTHEQIDTGDPAPRQTTGSTPNGSGNNDAEQVYRKLIEPYPQIFLMLSGHAPGNGRLTSTTALGRTVHEVMADYQSDPNGGNGWLMLVRFRPDDDEIDFETLSPTYVPGVTTGPDRSVDPDGNFTLDFDLAALREHLSTRTFMHYRQGQDNGLGVYTGAVDTHIGNGSHGTILPNVAYGGADNVRVDGNSDFEQGLLRFDDIVGPGASQIPQGTPIHQAILTLTTEGQYANGDGAMLHRMLVPWDGSSTWDGLGNGVQPSSEAEAVADTDTGFVAKGTRSFDVTTSVQAWVDGAPNHGWVALANGTNRWEFRSSDWAAPAERPMLTVVTSSGITPVPAASFASRAALAIVLLGCGIAAGMRAGPPARPAPTFRMRTRLRRPSVPPEHRR